MNLFADRLFALLLGWTGSLFNSLWNLLTNNSAGLAGFLRRFWLPLIIILLLFGTAVDYIIWLIRWRPYYVWSARLRQWGGRRRLRHTQHYMEDLDHSPLDLPEYYKVQQQVEQTGVLDEPVYFNFDEPWQPGAYGGEQMVVEEEQFQATPPLMQMEEEPQFVPHLPWEGLRQELLEQSPQLAHFDSQPQQILPLDQVPWQQLEQVQPTDPGLASFQNPELPPQAAQTRRRRVDNRRQRGADFLRNIKSTFFIREEDMAPVDSIQAPVSPEPAYHKPYYPQNYSYKNQQPAMTPPEQNGQEHPPQ